LAVDEADLIAGMTPTGRRLATPAAELVEAQDARGLKHLVWCAQEQHRSHPALTADLQLGWMESPDVTGLARLAHHDPDQGLFAYATGTCFTVAEIVRIYAEEEAGAGVKAGLELCYLVAEALSEAADAAVDLGVFSHGNLNPWTIVIKPDGQPLILCYGLPQVEMQVWQEDPRQVPKEDSFRYAPPERLEGHDEDIASDLFTLALVGLELMVGRPVYDGLLDDIRQQATRGEGMRRLYQWREQLPANVREVLGRALKPDPDTRYRRGLDFVYAVHDLLGSIDVEGPSLLEVMAKVRAVTKRGKGPIIGGKTGMLSAEELRELAADLDDIDDKPLPPPRLPRPEDDVELEGDDAEGDGTPQPRWQRRQAPEPPPPPDPKAEARDRLKRRLRRSGTAPGTPAAPEEKDARERLRRRLRESKSGSGNGDTPRRRLRRGSDGAAPDRRRRRPEPLVSQSIDLGEPVGFDESDEHTDIDLAPVSLPDLPDEDPAELPEEADETAVVDTADVPQPLGRVVAGPAEEEAETAVSPLATSGGAAALLQRLRGSTGERRRRRPRATPAPVASDDEEDATIALRRPDEAPSPASPGAAPPVALPPVAPPPPPPDPPAASSKPEREPEPEPERVLGKRRPPGFREPAPSPEPPASDGLDEPSSSLQSTVQLDDGPVGDVETTGSLEEVARLVSDGSIHVIGPGGVDVPLALFEEECIASVIRRAVAHLGLAQVDLEGRPTKGWRGRVGDHPLPGSTAAAGIERLHLLAEERSAHRLAVEHGGQRVRLVLPSCVTVGSVLPALGALFGLEGPIRASFAGQELPDAVLIGELRRKPLVLESV